MIEFKLTDVDDIDLILKLDKQEETQKYLGGIKNKSREERIEFLEKKSKNSTAYTVMLNKESIGFIELKINESYAEISYIFDCDYWGLGYGTKAVNMILDIGFNKLKLISIYAYTLDENIASKRVLEKNGFNYNNKIIKNDLEFLEYIIWGDKSDRD